MSSWCTKKGPDNPWYFEWILRPLLLGGPLSDIAIMEDFIESADPTEMNYTIVRPPRLTYGKDLQIEIPRFVLVCANICFTVKWQHSPLDEYGIRQSYIMKLGSYLIRVNRYRRYGNL